MLETDPISILNASGAQGSTLPEIYDGLLQGDIVETLDPLSVLAPLLTSRDEAAWRIAQLLVEKCSAREMILAAAESLEDLHRSIQAESDTEGEGDLLAFPDQALRLMQLYCAVISRVPIRKKGPASIVQGFLTELASVISELNNSIAGEKGRRLLACGNDLSASILRWAKGKEGINVEEIRSLHGILKDFIDSIVDSLAHCVEASLAERTFDEVFPRLAALHASERGEEWKEGSDILSRMIELYVESRGADFRARPLLPSKSSLVLFAHWQYATRSQHTSNQSSQLPPFLPVVLSSIQTNTILDETLSFLLLSLRRAHELSPEIVIPLSTILPSLCSAHPDPSIRHYAFRTLSLLLDSTEPPLRMQILQDLTSDKEAPQMRTAAVGLVKENLLNALNSKSDILASPMFLRTFGNILLAPDPPDFFKNVKIEISEEEQSELARLTECLGLLYVLILRDVGNKTGIRDKDNLANVERALLKPMKEAIPAWIDQATSSKDGHATSVMPLVSLQLSLDRAYEALERVRST
ncbi:hypothetical protein V5O48_000965 [Marasmius crinis-equi]|uniref:Uncharacterized protein n=1 Tax=Marasmius crinis-equi TaxID=585013 RepID=A0ABR3FZS1_9AGAR